MKLRDCYRVIIATVLLMASFFVPFALAWWLA